ncbi:MAG: glutaredoxin family protein [Nitrospirae bacterium]|nr:glutaredoxin family protein [Nitrospirota bacterium]
MYLSQKGVAFETRNVSHDEQAFRELRDVYNATGTPIIVIGDQVVRGFDLGRIRRLLNL